MIEHSFGGPWTDVKLRCLKNYLNEYRKIFSVNERARHFRTWYVDAFAGSGSRSKRSPGFPLLEFYEDAETQAYQEGSTKIALSLASPFDRYLFIERSPKFAAGLELMIQAEFQVLNQFCEVRSGDANDEILKWCLARDWSKERAVVFLDPYGMQVEWNTIQTLASTPGVDLWYLFPNIARLLPRDGKIPEAWNKRLTLLFGTETWQSKFLPIIRQNELFGNTESADRRVNETVVGDFIMERLASCFGNKVAKYLILRNSKSSPLYYLCFAASNEKGAKTALRIANYILKE
jgi:three-Cys-motif partner protein